MKKKMSLFLVLLLLFVAFTGVCPAVVAISDEVIIQAYKDKTITQICAVKNTGNIILYTGKAYFAVNVTTPGILNISFEIPSGGSLNMTNLYMYEYNGSDKFTGKTGLVFSTDSGGEKSLKYECKSPGIYYFSLETLYQPSFVTFKNVDISILLTTSSGDDKPAETEGWEIRAYAKTPVISVNKESSIDINFMLYYNGEIADLTPSFIFAIENNNIAQISDTIPYKNETRVTVKGLQSGTTYIKAQELNSILPGQTDRVINIPITVADQEENYYMFNEFAEVLGDGITNYNSDDWLCVDKFSAIEGEDGYSVSMEIYNYRQLYGAVSVFDADGKLIKVEQIDKHDKYVGSLYDEVKGLWQLPSDIFNLVNYDVLELHRSPNITKKTTINDLYVPFGGHIEISTSMGTLAPFLYNAVNLTITTASQAGKILKEFEPDQIEEMSKKAVEKIIFEKALDSEVKNIEKNLIQGIQKRTTQSIIILISGTLRNYEIDLFDIIKEVIPNDLLAEGLDVGCDILQDAIEKSSGLGTLIKGIYKLNDWANYVDFVQEINKNETIKNLHIQSPYGYSCNYRVSNDIKVIQKEYFEDNVILSAKYRISNGVSFAGITANDDNSRFYDISLFKNNKKIQPEKSVTVRIPIPENFNPNLIEIYHEVNGEWTMIKDIKIILPYVEFETSHFSLYAIVKKTGEAVSYDLNGDGKFNTKDLVRLMKYISAEGKGVNVLVSTDINGDGVTNSKDIVRMMNYLSKME